MRNIDLVRYDTGKKTKKKKNSPPPPSHSFRATVVVRILSSYLPISTLIQLNNVNNESFGTLYKRELRILGIQVSSSWDCDI
jgi:hypothetical protein